MLFLTNSKLEEINQDKSSNSPGESAVGDLYPQDRLLILETNSWERFRPLLSFMMLNWKPAVISNNPINNFME